MKNFRTYQLAIHLYKRCIKIKLQDHIHKDQFSRALLSIPLNLAEGYGREKTNDKKRFYTISLGSLREVQTLLLLEVIAKIIFKRKIRFLLNARKSFLKGRRCSPCATSRSFKKI